VLPCLARCAVVGLVLWFVLSTKAAENVPHRPFAQWADVLPDGQFVLGAVYEQSDADRIWAAGQHPSVSADSMHQGYFALQYGINSNWTADFNIGWTSMKWRYASGDTTQTTMGLMDWSFGVRYQIFNEARESSPWVPTLTFRAGAVLPGTYDQTFPFAPGLRSTSVTPELLLRKHFGWPGLGCYGDALYAWNDTTGNDNYITSIGLFQQYKGLEIDAGWRHLQFINGSDVVINPNNTITYPRDPREINDSIEAGISYTTPERHFRYGFQIRSVFAGNNADDKFWFGFSADFPFGGKRASQSAQN